MSETPEIRSPLIVLFFPHEWHTYARRPHWRAVCQLVPVLGIEPPVGLLTFWRHPRRLADWWQQRGPVSRHSENLWMMRPVSLLTYGLAHRLPLLARLDRGLVSWQVRRAVRRLRTEPSATAVFVLKVEQSHLADAVRADINCYEVTDEYRVSTYHERLDPDDPFTARAIRREARILKTADLVVVSSEALLESRSRENPNTHYLPNCAEYDHFARAAEQDTVVPDDLAAIPSPRLGLVGNLTGLIDVELLLRLAQVRSDCSIVFIGNEEGTPHQRQSQVYRDLKARPNVHFLGYRDYDILPGYVKGLDVCLLPYRQNAWLQASSPNKTYQYLAAGKPVVSIDFPEIRPVANVVYAGRNREEFVNLIDRALKTGSADDIAARQAVARDNDTDKRARALIDLVCLTLERKGCEACSTSEGGT